jgi:hypothetical protein
MASKEYFAYEMIYSPPKRETNDVKVALIKKATEDREDEMK